MLERYRLFFNNTVPPIHALVYGDRALNNTVPPVHALVYGDRAMNNTVPPVHTLVYGDRAMNNRRGDKVKLNIPLIYAHFSFSSIMHLSPFRDFRLPPRRTEIFALMVYYAE